MSTQMLRSKAFRLGAVSATVVFVLLGTALFPLTFNERRVVCDTYQGISEFQPRNSSANELNPNKVTIILLTYQRVPTLLNSPTLKTLTPLHIVDRLVIIWNDVGAEVPSSVFEKLAELNIDHKTVIVRPKKNSLNNRFIPWPEIRTEAVFSIDDDFGVNPDSFNTAFQWWKLNKHRLVGMYARNFVKRNGNEFEYQLVFHRGQEFNALLSGGGLMLNHFWLERYTNELPAELRQYVDSMFNCEDILMQFTVPAAFHPPLLVMIGDTIDDNAFRTTSDAEDRRTGISRQAGHPEKRVECLRHFHDVIGWPFIASKTTLKDNPPPQLLETS